LSQNGREFGCSGCNIVELVISGSRRMTLKAHLPSLQWSAADFIACDNSNPSTRPRACGSKQSISSVEEFTARRGLMRMLQQENHEVFASLGEWRSVPHATFAPGWSFTEAFDGRLLLLPFFHRAQSPAGAEDDVTLLLHMDASRLPNLDLVVRSWGGAVSVVIIVCVARLVLRSNCMRPCVTLHLQIRRQHRHHYRFHYSAAAVLRRSLSSRKHPFRSICALTRALPRQRAPCASFSDKL
jgi:hypothetical protein